MNSNPTTSFGAQLMAEGGTRFRLWAPSRAHVDLQLHAGSAVRWHSMERSEAGWHEAFVADAAAGARYTFVVEDGLEVPDPASRFNPDDVHGPSQVVDASAYAWRDADWRGRPWHEAVIYELHVGVFTPQGTFAAASERLADLAALGITAIELMPVADFRGDRNWGYDGVLVFAPDSSYGTPDDLKALVDEAHRLGLMVLLDVVYNHFGPDGNFLPAYCPEFFNAAHRTPWGSAINFDGPHNETVRRFFVENALHWVGEYHFDGLRLDAVHAMRDDSPQHIVCAIGDALRDGPGRTRQVHLVLENERNEARRLVRDADGLARCATAQWNDDLHHAAHVLLTGETDRYYADYAERPDSLLARALAEGFVYQGQPSPMRQGEAHGEPCTQLPSTAFVSFVQNHDHVGNRAFGDRLDRLADASRVDAMYACLLLSPHVPMLFCGEEFAASTPFLYFCDFEGDLGKAVSEGRVREFSLLANFETGAGSDDADGSETPQGRIPDPNAIESFTESKLRWEERGSGVHAERLALIGRLLSLRRQHLVPRLSGLPGAGRWHCEGGAARVEWALGDGARWTLLVNFGATEAHVAAVPVGETIYCSHCYPNDAGGVWLQPNGVMVVLEGVGGR